MTNIFKGTKSEDEFKFYGLKVLVKKEKSFECDFIGTVVRVLNNGGLIEVHPDFVNDKLVTFRYNVNRIEILK